MSCALSVAHAYEHQIVRINLTRCTLSLAFPSPPSFPSGERATPIAGHRAEAGDGEVQQTPVGHGVLYHRTQEGHQGARCHVSGELSLPMLSGTAVLVVVLALVVAIVVFLRMWLLLLFLPWLTLFCCAAMAVVDVSFCRRDLR